jgi:small subunit ribosomal protein S1
MSKFTDSLRAQTSAPEDQVAFNQAPSEFEELFKEREAQSPPIPGIVKGTVVSIRQDLGYVVVDIGYKSEGQISIDEFMANGRLDITKGDEVEVHADRSEGDDALIELSKIKADRNRVWEKISIACEKDELVRGRIKSKVKGGLSVDIEGVKAFLPGSQVDIRPNRNLDKFVTEDTEYEFKVIKFNRRRGNIVLSRRVLLEKDRAKLKAETLTKLAEGNILTGVVKNITHYGAFIDLGGIDGLLHQSDMSWGRVNSPLEILGENAENKPITVKVLRFTPESERVSLGLKQLREDPWTTAHERYQVNQRVQGKVVSLTDYGAFLELEEGIEGLIHVSEMSWTGNVKKPERFFSRDDVVEAVILDIDVENKRISLGYKQTQDNPWVELQAQFHPGSVIQGPIRNITDFGIFVSITQEIDGLVHISDLSWTQKIKHPSEVYKKGEVVEAVVLSVDVENQRFSLGIKQLTPDLWENEIPNRYSPGSIVKGEVSKIQEFGAFVRLEDGVEGLIHISELSDEHVKNPSEIVEEGQEVIVEVINIDRYDRKIGLTLKSTDLATFDQLIEEAEVRATEQEEVAQFSSSLTVSIEGE